MQLIIYVLCKFIFWELNDKRQRENCRTCVCGFLLVTYHIMVHCPARCPFPSLPINHWYTPGLEQVLTSYLSDSTCILLHILHSSWEKSNPCGLIYYLVCIWIWWIERVIGILFTWPINISPKQIEHTLNIIINWKERSLVNWYAEKTRYIWWFFSNSNNTNLEADIASPSSINIQKLICDIFHLRTSSC